VKLSIKYKTNFIRYYRFSFRDCTNQN